MSPRRPGDPLLYREISVPAEYCVSSMAGGRSFDYGGDIRMGDLRGTGQVDFLVYRSRDDAHDGGGMKPCFLGAFSMEGEPLWSVGEGGEQPSRPGPVAVHDLDGDGAAEVICFFVAPSGEGDAHVAPDSLADVVLQIRDGRTGELRRQSAPEALCACSGSGANWVHQRILIANLRGTKTPRDFIVKLGAKVLAFDESLELLWSYENPWTEYSRCPAYIPCVGDIDGDGRDEVNGGYYLLDHDGAVLWEKQLARHMDSVAIAAWDHGRMRAICSGYGHVMDTEGNAVLCLGEEAVPHGQEVRVARFLEGESEPQMLIRYNGHTPETMLVDVAGQRRGEITLNTTFNNTGMEPVYWDGPRSRARLCNGNTLWDLAVGEGAVLPGLPDPEPRGRMAWYHCIPADVCGDVREEVILYNPWTTKVFVYTPYPLDESSFAGFCPTARQYNPRLMD